MPCSGPVSMFWLARSLAEQLVGLPFAQSGATSCTGGAIGGSRGPLTVPGEVPLGQVFGSPAAWPPGASESPSPPDFADADTELGFPTGGSVGVGSSREPLTGSNQSAPLQQVIGDLPLWIGEPNTLD